jgi:hypothetical protein
VKSRKKFKRRHERRIGSIREEEVDQDKEWRVRVIER